MSLRTQILRDLGKQCIWSLNTLFKDLMFYKVKLLYIFHCLIWGGQTQSHLHCPWNSTLTKWKRALYTSFEILFHTGKVSCSSFVFVATQPVQNLLCIMIFCNSIGVLLLMYVGWLMHFFSGTRHTAVSIVLWFS